MDKFKTVEISDKKWIENILKKTKNPSLEYNFTTLFIWQEIYNTKVREYKNCLLVRFGKERNVFLFPAGTENIKDAVDFILKENKDGYICIGGIVEEQKAFLEKNYPGMFEYTEDRDMSDYIYTTESLTTLKGKKLSSKRNHINRFIENYPQWSYEEISENNIGEVKDMHEEWCRLMKESGKNGLEEEGMAVRKALKYYKELELHGGAIRADGNIIAFELGDELNEQTFIVHIEKAFAHIQGAYPMINKQFVIHNCQNYKYIDREEDAGDEGLRKAKLSYNPSIILKKYNAVKKYNKL